MVLLIAYFSFCFISSFPFSSVCQLIEIMLLEAVNGQDLKYINSWSQAVVALSVLWGTAGLIDVSSRGRFDKFFKILWQGTNITV